MSEKPPPRKTPMPPRRVSTDTAPAVKAFREKLQSIEEGEMQALIEVEQKAEELARTTTPPAKNDEEAPPPPSSESNLGENGDTDHG